MLDIDVNGILNQISPSKNRDDWMTIGTIFKGLGGSFECFDDWSSRGEGYNKSNIKSEWKSWKPESLSIKNPKGFLIQCAKNEGGCITPISIPTLPSNVNIEKIINTDRVKKEVKALWDSSEPIKNNPYLSQKGITPYGDIRHIPIKKVKNILGKVKIKGSKGPLQGDLLIYRIGDETGIKSCQLIDGEGSKHNLLGGQKQGSWWSVEPIKDKILIAEGIATALSAYKATGTNTVVAIDSGNLITISEKIRSLNPETEIIILGEIKKDGSTEPSHIKACESVGGKLALPHTQGSDFNDMHQEKGLEAVREAIEKASPVSKTLSSPQHKFQFVRLDSLEIKPIDWLVKNFIESDSLGLVYGQPGHGKSFIAIDLASCVATGEPWHGNEVKKGSVFYIAGEGQNGITRRFKAWEKKNGKSLSGCPIYPSTTSIDLNNDGEVNHVIDIIKATGKKPKLIIIDTLARNYIGDENSSKDMSVFIKNIDRLRNEWGCTVLTIHHSGKDTERGARGSTALKGAIDAEYKASKNENGLITFDCQKMKDSEQPEPMYLQIEGVQLDETEEDGSPIQGAALVLGESPPNAEGKSKIEENKKLFQDAWLEKGDIVDKDQYLSRENFIQYLVERKGFKESTAKKKVKPSSKGQPIFDLMANSIITPDKEGWIVTDKIFKSVSFLLKENRETLQKETKDKMLKNNQKHDVPAYRTVL